MNLKSPPRNHGKKKRATIHIEIAHVNVSLDSIFPLPSNHSKKKSVTIHTKIAPVNEPHEAFMVKKVTIHIEIARVNES